MKHNSKFWIQVCIIWIFSTLLDRIWWNNYQGIPAWDQADYLNSALDHGRALGILQGGRWEGFQALLDLSPKIPPLASLVNSSILRIAGEAPKDAAWSLSIWNGILLFSTAGWGLHLRNKTLGLLATVLIAIAPGLAALRSDYVLEIPLVSISTLALWRISCWWDPITGRRWIQALIASFCSAAAILIKQTALLALVPAIGIVFYTASKDDRSTKKQFLTSIIICFSIILPWLHHNWITILSGTNRAVFESAKIEGDPSILSIESWLWYPRLLPQQISPIILLIGLSGCIIWIIQKYKYFQGSIKFKQIFDNKHAWLFLIFNITGGFILTTLSPNKDARYISQIIPLFLLIIARGWIEWGLWLKNKQQSQFKILIGLFTSICVSIPYLWHSQWSKFKQAQSGPLKEIIQKIKKETTKQAKTTVVIVPSTQDLNQHNFSYFGRIDGRNIVGRQLGNSKQDIDPVLKQSQWIVLAEGDQGSIRATALDLDQAIRKSSVFKEIKRFPRAQGGSYSLWNRRQNIAIQDDFAERFTELAKGLSEGPKGLEIIFNEIAIQHMIDGHFSYREPVRTEALRKLKSNPRDTDAYWTLALIAILENRPREASNHFQKLHELIPINPWPSAYQAFVEIADWNPWAASKIADSAFERIQDPILKAIGDLSGILGGQLWRLPEAANSIPSAVQIIERELAKND